MNYRCLKGLALFGLLLATSQRTQAQTAIGATFGDVITLPGGTPSDIVLDELRHVLYLVQNKTNQVLIFDYTSNQIVGSIGTGKTPLAAGISMDGAWLYVTCSGSTSLNVIDLSINRVVQRLQMAKIGYVNAAPVRQERVTAGIAVNHPDGVARETAGAPTDPASKE